MRTIEPTERTPDSLEQAARYIVILILYYHTAQIIRFIHLQVKNRRSTNHQNQQPI